MKARSIFALLFALMLMLSACGGDDTDADAGDAATPTAVTEVEPAATPTPAEEATPTTAAETGTMTETETMTETSVMTETEVMTDAAGPSEGTPTAEATLTGTDEMTDTEMMTGTTGMTGGEGITGTDEMTDTEGMMDSEEMTDTGDASGAVTGAAATDMSSVRGVVRASELLGYGVQNSEGEDLGSINDAMVSLQDGCIDYMILSFGGILGLGDSLYLVPWRAITVEPQTERLVFNVQPEALNEAPVFDTENLPDLTAEDWDVDVSSYWDTVEVMTPNMTDTMTSTTDTAGSTGTDAMMGMTPCAGAMAAGSDAATETGASQAVTDTASTEGGIAVETPRIMRLSELLGFGVTNSEGDDLGSIEDIMIDWRQDRIVYPILSFGGFLGLGEKWFAIPLDQITLDPIDQRLVFDVELEQLENAPGFDAATLPDTTDPSWDEEIRNYWTENQ